ncbi:MAG: molybdopterin-dependent oxidoreductase [Betaproteobacteria bacterium]|nr:molybdopterin-dependent oxidoreductase [Betaproteobacteria bacterium]
MNDMSANSKLKSGDDAWVPSACAICYGSCSITGHRVDGVLVKIEGNPDSVIGKGRLCGKGVAGIMTHYDPNRLTVPLRRTNPKKGFDVDPGWKEISWDEALDEIASQLRRIHKEDPRKLVLHRTTTITASRTPMQGFASAFGTPNIGAAGGGLHCGNGAHQLSGMMHSSWSVVPDFEYCNYTLSFGASKGHSAGHSSNSNMKLAADARARGMKMVVVDPFCNFAAAKATEWVPLRVGTDGAVALAMCQVLVNELGIYDAPYLQAKTNAPYLIGPNKLYIRDPETKKPMVWDMKAKAARPFTDAVSADMALEGEFEVNGVKCRPAFVLLREHLKTHTPEWAEGISTVPAANIRRIAGEFGHEARIGSTIVVDGVTLPYRPVAAIAFRGSQGHVNSLYNFFAIDLLNELVGSSDVVGGCLGFNPACHGFPETGRLRYVPHPDPDGLMIAGMWMGYHYPYPISDPKVPKRIGLQDLYTMGMMSPFDHSDEGEELRKKFELPYEPEVLLNFGCNLVMSIGNKDQVARALQKYKFIASIDIFHNETSYFCDILLPDCSYIQGQDSRANFPFLFNHPAGMGEWCWPIRQAVLPPDGEQRRFQDILIDLADRVGVRADYNAAYNAQMRLEPPYRLEGDTKYTFDEICDRELRNNFGDQRGLEWFKKNGVIKWPKKPQEVYWRAFVDVRVPVYWEFMISLGEKTEAIAAPRGVKTPREFFEPLPEFLPCTSHVCKKPGFDFYGFYYRDIIHANSYTQENPWLDEAGQMDPFSYTIAINADSAKKRGLADGQLVWLENEQGKKVQGRLHLTQGIHPEGLGVGGCAGHWAGRGMPIAKGKGVFFNDLLELDAAHSSPVNLNLDVCVKIKVTPVEGVQ